MKMQEKILLHVCCAPCAIVPHRMLQAENFAVATFFYNPNIQPYKEFCRRRDAVREWAARDAWTLTLRDEYPIEEWLSGALQEAAGRCAYCYRSRLEEAANQALAAGCRYFTTSLLISPYQQHDKIAALGKAVGENKGIEFLYRDFRPQWSAGVQASREAELYRQPYCGCIFSERDRYSNLDTRI